eukprot:4563566-Prorocentrum_lima.AAC.1
MTSSLVGSEMCIRDSGWVGVGRLVAGGFGGWPEARVPSKLRYRFWHRNHCLLYTSDAADDM